MSTKATEAISYSSRENQAVIDLWPSSPSRKATTMATDKPSATEEIEQAKDETLDHLNLHCTDHAPDADCEGCRLQLDALILAVRAEQEAQREALPNQDCVIHLPRPDCPFSDAHLIDACGAFEPKGEQAAEAHAPRPRIEDIAEALRSKAAAEALAPYLKEGESVVECVMRNRNDVDILLGQLAHAKRRAEQAEALLASQVREKP